MFGDLFADESPKQSGGAKVAPSKLSAPPPPRPEHGFCGLANQGATCYLNCLLQTLYMTPEFKNGLFSLTDEELGCHEGTPRQDRKARIIPIQLRRLFARLQLVNERETTTTELTDSFGWKNSEELQQHDVQELNRILFGAIEESLYGTSGHKLIKELYHGTIVNKIVCQDCGYTSEREEDFLDLCVAVSGNLGLENSLYQYYTQTERLDGRNQYRCEHCARLVNAVRSAKIRHLPSILTVSLLRFSFDFTRMERYKETGRFSFPMELEMNQYCEVPDEESVFELFSVIIHSGSAHGGHYHAYIRDLNSLGDWSEPDDVFILPKKRDFDVLDLETPQNVLESVLLELKSASLDQICAEIVKSTGVSWNKRYKAKYGPISKFLKRFEDKFTLNDGIVTLKDGGYAQSNAHAQPNSDWFDFNDGKIRPIRTSEIETQFSGRESCYMLIYRRKGVDYMNREVPEYLVKEIEELNRKLDEDRQNFDRSQNETTFTLITSQDAVLENGFLKLKDDIETTKFTLDRRKECRLLYEEVQKQWNMSRENCGIYIAKIQPAGLHLYREIPENDEILNDIFRDSEMQIFVSDNIGKEYPIGVEHEPIILALDFGDSSTQLPFFKSTTLSQVLKSLEMSSPCTVKVIKADSSRDPFLLTEEEQKRALSELGLEDFDQIVLTDNGQAFKPGMISLLVENHLETTDIDETFTIEIHPDKTVEALRMDILRHLSLKEGSNDQYRLRIEDDLSGIQTPLRLESTLKDKNLKSGSRIIFQKGPLPKPSQIALNFKAENSLSTEVFIEKSWTVAKCLETVMTSLRLEDSDWFLQTTTWCGEADHVLADPDAEIERFGLKDGDVLLVQKGRPLPPGLLRLGVWLYPTIVMNDGCRQGWIRHAQGDEQAGGDSFSSEFCGEIEISKTANVVELKEIVSTLPQLQNHIIPTLEFIRVRKIDQGYHTSILRPQSNLNRQKVASDGLLAVQVLSSEEKLSASEIVVNVYERRPDEDLNSVSVSELILNLDAVNSVSKLYRTVSDHLGLPSENCLLAKHVREKFEWILFRENKTSNAKKKGTNKINFRGQPYFLKDGDVIAVKRDVTSKCGHPDDFLTFDDIIGRERLKQEAEDKRRRRRERKSSLTAGPEWLEVKPNKRKEHSLNIHVENFRIT